MGPDCPIAAPNTVLHFCSKRNIELNGRPASSEISLLHQQSQGPIEATPLEDLWWKQRLEQIQKPTQLHPAINNPMRFLAFDALKGLQTPRRLIRYTVEKASGVLVWSGKLHDQHREQNGVWRRASSKSFWRRASSNFNRFLLRFPLSNPRKAKIQTIGFQTLVENVPDDPEKATWKALTLPTNALPGNPFFIHLGRKVPNPRPYVFILRWKSSIPRMQCFLPGHNTLIHSSNAPPALGHEPTLLLNTMVASTFAP